MQLQFIRTWSKIKVRKGFIIVINYYQSGDVNFCFREVSFRDVSGSGNKYNMRERLTTVITYYQSGDGFYLTYAIAIYKNFE